MDTEMPATSVPAESRIPWPIAKTPRSGAAVVHGEAVVADLRQVCAELVEVRSVVGSLGVPVG
jgi:hypothetical protein